MFNYTTNRLLNCFVSSWLLILAGCGMKETPDTWVYPQLVNEIHAEALEDMWEDCSTLNMMADCQAVYKFFRGIFSFDDEPRFKLEATVMAVCRTDYEPLTNIPMTYINIRPNVRVMFRLSPIQYKALVLHELYHCILRMDHIETATPNIMQAYVQLGYYKSDAAYEAARAHTLSIIKANRSVSILK